MQKPVKADTMYCMPKRYADSVDYHLRKGDQAVKLMEVQKLEIKYAWDYADMLQEEVNQLDSLNTDNVTYFEEDIIPHKNRTIKTLAGIAILEFIVIIIITR